MKVVFDGRVHGVEREVDSLSSGELRGRNEIAVARNQDNLAGLFLVRDRCDVDADAHIDAFLMGDERVIVRDKVIDGDLVRIKQLDF